MTEFILSLQQHWELSDVSHSEKLRLRELKSLSQCCGARKRRAGTGTQTVSKTMLIQ